MNSAQSAAAPALRRSQARGERTRDRLLVSARELFARRGYEGTSIGDVARAAGVGVGTVYHHFADKRALLIALLERYEGGIEFDEAADDRGGLGVALEERDVGTALHALVRVAVDLRRRHPSVRPIGEELARRDSEVAECCERLDADLRRRLRLAIEYGQTLGKLRPEIDPYVAASLLHPVAVSLVTGIAEQPDNVDVEPLIAECASLLRRYLLP